jgi:hypothetical protein
MYPRTNYEMTEEDLQIILDACKLTPVMMIGSYTGSSPQENANRAWRSLGEKMGFEWDSVQPIDGKGMRFFTAIPSETPEARIEREKCEEEAAKLAEIKKLEEEIEERQEKLSHLDPKYAS